MHFLSFFCFRHLQGEDRNILITISDGVICETEKIVDIGASQQTYRVEFSVTRWCEFIEGIGWH